MNRQIKDVAKNIFAKKDMEKNLSLFADYIGRLYNRFSYVCLSMNYDTLYEIFAEETYDEEVTGLMSVLNDVIRDSILSGNVSVEDIKKTEDVRNKIISRMKVLTAYADIFVRYEYIINRIEYRFSGEELPADYSDEDFTAKLMAYIVSDKDSVVINSKICEVLAELPMRMAKSKFFEHLNEGIDLYKDTDKKSFEDFLYRIRSSAMLELPDTLADIYDELKSIHQSFKDADYDTITADQYQVLKDKLNTATAFVEDTVSIHMLLQEVVNDVYALLITGQYAEEANETDICKKIIAPINENFFSNAISDDSMEEYFISLEGSQEKINDDIMSAEHVLDDIQSRLSGCMGTEELENRYNSLYKAQVLLSESLFVEFDGNNIDVSEPDRVYFEQRKRDLLEEVETFFKTHNRAVNRSVMSAILSSLPVFFNNLSELREYIYHSLDSCRQKAEKTACIEILDSLMEG